jgi:MFS family permease
MTLEPGVPGRDRTLTLAMCVTCALSVAPFGSYPALLPRLFADGLVSTRDATFINAAFFAGYMLVAPVATTLTDRLDSRRLVLPALTLGAVCALCFAAFYDNFAAAVVARAANGACVAASFMPGLRALTDRVAPARGSRFVGFYMSSFALGTSVSYVVSDLAVVHFGLTPTLYAVAMGPLLGRIIVALYLRPVYVTPKAAVSPLGQLRPVFRESRVISLVLAYGMHCAELFVLRSWCVAFLASVQRSEPFGASLWLAPANVVALANLLTAPASVLGNELSMRIGAKRYIAVTLTASPLCLGALGFLHPAGTWVCIVAVLFCAMVLGSDSAAITSRLIEAAPPAQRGATMAIHTAVGFMGAFLGPLVLGLVLDAAGGPTSPLAWSHAFLAVGALSLCGSLAVLMRKSA